MNSAPAAAGLLVRNPREQKQVVLSSRTSVGWRENSDIWKTTGVPDSAKHQYVHQHLPQCGKALKVVQGEPGLPKPGLGAELEPATLGNAARWMGCSVHNLHRSKKKSQDNQQLNSNCLWHLSLHPQPLLSEPGLGLTFPGLVPGVYFLCLCITEGPTWLSTV